MFGLMMLSGEALPRHISGEGSYTCNNVLFTGQHRRAISCYFFSITNLMPNIRRTPFENIPKLALARLP